MVVGTAAGKGAGVVAAGGVGVAGMITGWVLTVFGWVVASGGLLTMGCVVVTTGAVVTTGWVVMMGCPAIWGWVMMIGGGAPGVGRQPGLAGSGGRASRTALRSDRSDGRAWEVKGADIDVGWPEVWKRG